MHEWPQLDILLRLSRADLAWIVYAPAAVDMRQNGAQQHIAKGLGKYCAFVETAPAKQQVACRKLQEKHRSSSCVHLKGQGSVADQIRIHRYSDV